MRPYFRRAALASAVAVREGRSGVFSAIGGNHFSSVRVDVLEAKAKDVVIDEDRHPVWHVAVELPTGGGFSRNCREGENVLEDEMGILLDKFVEDGSKDAAKTFILHISSVLAMGVSREEVLSAVDEALVTGVMES